MNAFVTRRNLSHINHPDVQNKQFEMDKLVFIGKNNLLYKKLKISSYCIFAVKPKGKKKSQNQLLKIWNAAHKFNMLEVVFGENISKQV